MLSLAWLLWVAVVVVVEVCVSVLCSHEHEGEGAEVCILASLQNSGVQGGCTIVFSVVLSAEATHSVGWCLGWVLLQSAM